MNRRLTIKGNDKNMPRGAIPIPRRSIADVRNVTLSRAHVETHLSRRTHAEKTARIFSHEVNASAARRLPAPRDVKAFTFCIEGRTFVFFVV